MRLGIIATQISSLALPGKTPHEMLAALLAFDHAALARRVVDEGFKLVELSGDFASFFPPALGPQAVEGLAALKQETGIRYTVHLPFWSLEPASPLAEARRACANANIGVIRATLPLEPEVYVFHASGYTAEAFYRMDMPEQARPYVLQHLNQYAQDTVDMILDESGLDPHRLAVETINFPFELTLDLAETLDTAICLDVGHVLAGFAGPIDLWDALDACLPRLAEVHLHDSPWQGPGRVIQSGRDHQALGRGDLDVAGLFERLDDAGFGGPIIFELTLAEAQESLAHIDRTAARLRVTEPLMAAVGR